jgi:glucose/arabinose dehydrogenase
MTRSSDSRVRTTHRVGALAGVLTVVLGITVVACSSPTPSSSPDTTPSSTTSIVPDTGTGPLSITQELRATEVAGGLAEPTAMVNRPMRNQLWVAERSGRVRVITIATNWNLETGSVVRNGYKTLGDSVLDISGDVSTEGERGLLGIAFSTDARTLFLEYSNKKGEIVVASWNVNDPAPPPVTVPAPTAPDPEASTTSTRPGANSSTTSSLLPTLPAPVVDGGSRRVLLTIPHGDATTDNGGQLALGRDGFLYIGVGDGAAVTDPTRNAQNPDSLLGKILRIDPGSVSIIGPYGIPPTNPFVAAGGAPQVWILGTRNPGHFSFDKANGDLWVADPGDRRYEEIDLLPAAFGGGRGANLGWPWKSGTELLDPAATLPAGLVDPVLVSVNTGDVSCSIIGGYVYRGSAIPGLKGIYLYGDSCSGEVRGLLERKGIKIDDKALGPKLAANTLVGFGQDDQGELYAVSSGGSILLLVAA